jgi:hypothetical protein
MTETAMAKSDDTQGSGTGRKRAARKTAAPETGAATPAAAGEGGTTANGGSTAKTPRKTRGTGTGGGGGGGARKRAGGGGDAGAGGGRDLRSDLREFISSRPHGWGHDDWTGLLGSLGERGHDVSDPDRVGRSLERERLLTVLERVEGLEGRQAEALAERYQTLWSFRHAGTEEVAATAGIDHDLAERAKQAAG